MNLPNEQTLEQILVDCLHQIDQGQQVDLEQLALDYPDLADDLNEYFESADIVQQWAGPTHLEHSAATASIDTSRIIDQRLNTLPLADQGTMTSDWNLPYEFGRYRLLEQLGAGAMGSVFLAYDTRLERNVAIKIPRQKFQPGSETHLRFEREARAAAAIQHRNICPVHDIGEYDGIQYIAMSFVSGQTLAEHNRQGDRSRQESVKILSKLAEALSLTHKRNVIHRDLKPSNVIIDDEGEPVITDFGLALQSDAAEHSRVTQHGTIVGTPAYMAPEQIDPDLGPVGPASEIYSLGVIFYEMLTGRLPFEGSLSAVMNQVLTKSPKPPWQLDSTIPKSIDRLCLKMLEKSPKDRFHSMEAILEELDRIESGHERRSPRMAWFAMGLFLSCIPLFYWVWTTWQSGLSEKSQANQPHEEAPDTVKNELNLFQFQRSLLGHSGPIRGITYSPDGKKAASCSGGPRGDCTIRIWNLERLETEKVLKGHAAGVMSVSFSADGSRLVSADDETGLLVWDVAQGRLLHQLEKTIGVETVVFLDETTFCISSSRNKEVQIWNAVQGKQERSISLASTPRQIAYHRSLRRIATALESGEISLIDPEGEESKQVVRPQSSSGPVNCVAFAPDGKHIAVGTKKQILVCEIESRKSLAVQQPRESRKLVFTPDGQNIINISTQGECEMFDVASGRKVAHQNPPIELYAVSISPDGKSMLCGGTPKDENSRDFAVQIIGIKTQNKKSLGDDPGQVARLLHRFEGHTAIVKCVKFSPDGKLLASCSDRPDQDASVRFWNVETGKQTAVCRGHKAQSIQGEFTPDGKRFLTASTGNYLILWDVRTGREIKRMKKPEGLHDLCVLSNRYACTTNGWEKTLLIWDLETGEIVKRYPRQHGKWTRLDHDHSGEKLMVANNQGEIKVLNVRDFSTVAQLRMSEVSINGNNSAATLSNDGQVVAMSWKDEAIAVWNVKTKELLQRWNNVGPAVCFRFLPHNRQLIRVTYPGHIHSLNPLTGETKNVAHAGDESVYVGYFAERKTHRHWRPKTSQRRRRLCHPTLAITQIALAEESATPRFRSEAPRQSGRSNPQNDEGQSRSKCSSSARGGPASGRSTKLLRQKTI